MIIWSVQGTILCTILPEIEILLGYFSTKHNWNRAVADLEFIVSRPVVFCSGLELVDHAPIFEGYFTSDK